MSTATLLLALTLMLTLAACATSSPSTPMAEPAPAGTFHTVRAGETVWDLARRSGLSVEEIVEVNGLPSADDVAAGQVLFLPAGGRALGLRGRSDADESERTEPEQADPPHVAPGATPLAWPVDGVVLRDFAAPTKARRAPFDGLLIAAPTGTAVRAAADGEVMFVGDQGTDYGLLVVVRHGPAVTTGATGVATADDDHAEGEPLVTIYGHLADAVVKAGDSVRAGARIGSVGTSGGVESPRLHFQARRGRTAVDPLPLLPP